MKKAQLFFLWLVILPAFIGSIFLGYFFSLRGRIYQNIFVAGIDIGRLSTDQAIKKIEDSFQNVGSAFIINKDGVEFERIEITNFDRNFTWAVEQAYLIGRSGNLFLDAKEKIFLLFWKKDLAVPVDIDNEFLADTTEKLSKKVDTLPIWPSFKKTKDNYELLDGVDGLILDREDLAEKIKKNLSVTKPDVIEIVTKHISTKIDDERRAALLQIANNWINKTIILNHKEYNKLVSEKEILSLLGLNGNFFNQESLLQLADEISVNIETEPRNAVFEFSEGKVKEFKPEVYGITLDRPRFSSLLEEAISSEKDRIEIPIISEEPEVKTEEINSFGIKELIGVGKSSFSHSIPGRVFNVNLAASRISGVIVPPGEEFSFDKTVGEISKQTGYQTAYIISQGKTVLGDGGGVCQVSTTTFRAALDAGLPITERKAHAYRVGYYEQDSAPGIDATIFYPSVDLRFLNDTGHHILIQSTVDTKNLTMKVEIYGTSDGRVSTVSKPVISSQIPAPEAIYVDDPTLPVGTTRQIDWAAAGAKVSFDYKVERNSETLIDKTFYSNYQPWRAVFLRGTGQ